MESLQKLSHWVGLWRLKGHPWQEGVFYGVFVEFCSLALVEGEVGDNFLLCGPIHYSGSMLVEAMDKTPLPQQFHHSDVGIRPQRAEALLDQPPL